MYFSLHLQFEESERRISAQETATSEAKSTMSTELETRMGVFATEIASIRSTADDHTKHMADMLDLADASKRELALTIQTKADELAMSIQSKADELSTSVKGLEQQLTTSIQGLEQQLAASSESLSAVKNEIGDIREQGVASASRLDTLQGDLSVVRDQGTAFIGRLDKLQGDLSEAQAASSSGLQDAGKRLEALEGALTRLNAIEEAAAR